MLGLEIMQRQGQQEYLENKTGINVDSLIRVVTRNYLKINNKIFRKKHINKYTCSARGSRSVINYVLVNNKNSQQIQDVHVCRGADIYSGHYLLIAKIVMSARLKRKKPRVKSNEKSIHHIPVSYTHLDVYKRQVILT